MVVDAVTMLDELLPLNMIGIKKVQGGSLEETVLVILPLFQHQMTLGRENILSYSDAS